MVWAPICVCVKYLGMQLSYTMESRATSDLLTVVCEQNVRFFCLNYKKRSRGEEEEQEATNLAGSPTPGESTW